MAATVTSVWGLGVILGVAVLLIGTIVIGMAGRARRRRRRREQALERGQQLAEQVMLTNRDVRPGSTQPEPPFEPSAAPSFHAADSGATDFPADDVRSSDPAEGRFSDASSAPSAPFADEHVTRSTPVPPHPTPHSMAHPEETDQSAVVAPQPVGSAVEHVTVRVQTSNDDPLDHAVLTVAELDGQQVVRAESGGDGSYDLGPLASGSYVLIVRCRGFRPYAEVIEVGDGMPRCTRVELGSDSGLAGVVRRKDGEPVAGATVTLKGDHGVVMTARTGPDGDYRVTGIRPGPYTMLVTARVCRPVELAVDVPERGLSRQDVELIGGAHVQGTVRVDQGRKVLPGTRILLLDERGEVLATTDADEQGRYRFSEVNAGEYTVCATPPSPAVSTVRIDGGLVHELDLELRQTG